MSKAIPILFVILASILCSCDKRNETYLKHLRSDNSFLSEQLSQKRNLFKYKYIGFGYLPYVKLFMQHDTLASLFIKTINSCNEEDIETHYCSFIKKTNQYFDSAKKTQSTRFLKDDEPLLILHHDSLSSEFSNTSAYKELIINHVLKYRIVLADLIASNNSTCGIRFDKPSSFGFRLTIEKGNDTTFLELAYINPRKSPYLLPLEFTGLNKCDDEFFNCYNKTENISNQVFSFATVEEKLHLKVRPLKKGHYQIVTNTVNVSGSGKLEKDEALFNFEIN